MVVIGGIIVEKKNKVTKNNNMRAFITLEYLFGTIECIVFPATFERYNKFLEEDKIVVVKGKISTVEEEEAKLIVEKISDLQSFNTSKLYLKLSVNSLPNIMDRIVHILKNSKAIHLFMYILKRIIRQ